VRFRVLLLTLVIPAFGAGITACGQMAPRHVPRVRLELRSPADGTRVTGSSITLRGTVSPAAAEVRVFGRRASVRRDGTFSARVSLRAGVNLIDVLASLPHASGAMSALRVERYVLVAVPQVLGDSPSDAEAALRAAGLVPEPHSTDNALSSLFPLPVQVCSMSPQPGTEVSPGSTVTLSTAKVCGLASVTVPSTSATPVTQPGPPARSTEPVTNPGPPPAAGRPGRGQGPNGTGPPGQDKPPNPGHPHGPPGDQGDEGGD
jgi:Glucodextranase, domain B/PASTA domain